MPPGRVPAHARPARAPERHRVRRELRTGSISAGARTTVIDARGSSRVIEVPADSTAALAGLTITGGNAATGGGAFVADGGALAIYDSIVKDNAASGRGGGVANAGNLSVFGSTLTGNSAAQGGAIASEANTNTYVYLSTLSGNSASGSGGASGRVGIGAGPAGDDRRQQRAAGRRLLRATLRPLQALWGTLLAGNTGGACGGQTQHPHPLEQQSQRRRHVLLRGRAGHERRGPADRRADQQRRPDRHARAARREPRDQRRRPELLRRGLARPASRSGVNACDIGSYEYGARLPEVVLPPPEAGETVNVFEARGHVRVKLPGSDEFFELEEAQQVPVGSTFDTSKGRVTLHRGQPAEVVVLPGRLQARPDARAPSRSARSRLTGGLSCGGAKRERRAAKARSAVCGATASGKFRTQGKFSSATVRRYQLAGRGPLQRHADQRHEGPGRVRDFARKRTVDRQGRQVGTSPAPPVSWVSVFTRSSSRTWSATTSSRPIGRRGTSAAA